MLEPLLIAVMLLAAAGCGWSYLQMQRSDARRAESDAELRDSTRLVGELADELSAAGQYLYDAMDECSAKIDAFERKWAERMALLDAPAPSPLPSLSAGQPLPQPASPALVTEDLMAEDLVAEELVAEAAPQPATRPNPSPARQVTASKMAAYRRAAYVQPGHQPSPEDLVQEATPSAFASLLAAAQQMEEEPTPDPIAEPSRQRSSGADADAQPAQGVYHPHFHALELAAQGADMIEIARQTGLGTEELRLLLRFREALSVE
jgi:hypothetical protein